MEISNMQLRLEDTCQGDRIMGIKGDDGVSVAVILRRIQDCLHVREDRAAELERIRGWMKIGHRIFADAGEVESKILAAGLARQCLVRSAGGDGLACRR